MRLFTPLTVTSLSCIAGVGIAGTIIWKKYNMNYKSVQLLFQCIKPSYILDENGYYRCIIPTRVPSIKTLNNAINISNTENKPINFDFWQDSVNKKAFIAVNTEKNEKILAKNQEYYTTPIIKIYGSDTEYVIVTALTVFVVDRNLPIKKAHYPYPMPWEQQYQRQETLYQLQQHMNRYLRHSPLSKPLHRRPLKISNSYNKQIRP